MKQTLLAGWDGLFLVCECEPIGDEPIQIGDRVWWVGHRQENDPFSMIIHQRCL